MTKNRIFNSFGLKGQYSIAQPSGLGINATTSFSPCKGRIPKIFYAALSEQNNLMEILTQGVALSYIILHLRCENKFLFYGNALTRRWIRLVIYALAGIQRKIASAASGFLFFYTWLKCTVNYERLLLLTTGTIP